MSGESHRGHRAEPAGTRELARRLRADARRNLERILDAARDVFAELGPYAPLDEVVRRAGVGAGTLYRRFPDRQSLLRAVAMDTWARLIDEADRALAEEVNAFDALSRYMHRAVDLRVGAVMPSLMGAMPMDGEMQSAASRSAEAAQQLLTAAWEEGSLRRDVTFGDIGLLLIRMSRPMPSPFPRELDNALAHRHLELCIEGLRAINANRPLAGPTMTLEDLRSLSSDASRTSPEVKHPHRQQQ